MGRIWMRHGRLLRAASLCLGWTSVGTMTLGAPGIGMTGIGMTGIGVTGIGAAAATSLFSRPAHADPPASPRRHMIATSNRLATQAGLAILRDGGSAVDAAIAAAMVLAVVRPDQSGLGGGGILLHYDAAAQTVSVWDGRETAPAAASPDLFLEASGQLLDPVTAGQGGRAVGAPGLLRMLDAAHRRHGRLPWERLFAEAAALADAGAPVSPALAAALRAETARLSRQPVARLMLLRPDGTAPPAGSLLVDKPLADTLRAIAAGRSDALLSGAIAAEIATTVRTDPNPGLLTVDDLGATAAVERAPICTPYRLHLVCSVGPPSAGGLAVLEALGLLDHADMAALSPRPGGTIGVPAAHLLIEAERLAAADAAFYLADPAFVRAPLPGLLAPDYLTARARQIDRARTLRDVMPGRPSWDEPELRAAPPDQPQHGTSHLVAVDDAGNAVSLSAGLQDRFGSGLMVRGFLLNDALTAFSRTPQRDGRIVANRVEPGKRPVTAMAPAMVLDLQGRLELVIGSTGGDRIAVDVTQALVQSLDFHRDPRAAVSAPHVGAAGDKVILESNTVALGLASGLRDLGHATEAAPAASGLALIRLTPDGMTGAADPRGGEGDTAGD